MEQNFGANNIENENINQNNINNIDISNNQNYNRENSNIFQKFPDITITFLFFLTINLIIYIYSKINSIEIYKYVFQYFPIMHNNQFYRIISRYFIHFGIFHLLLELIGIFFLCKTFENSFGTIFTISIIFISMILDSFIQIILIPVFAFFLRGRFSVLSNFLYEGGLTPVLFTLLTYSSLYHKNRNQLISLESLFIFRAKYSYIYLLGALYFFTPNRTFYGNLSGIIGGHILKRYPKYLLPKIKWIKEIEDFYSLNKIKFLYRHINLSNNKMKDVLIEYDRESMEDIDN